ncbi:MAG: excinuclease ABC subunit UvrC [Nanoarchaeota archaeon]|nr:excinuclease ABC subunit UvrC [Nanoarchaeota archaeon]
MIDLSNLPDSPGCYIYKDKTGRIIYVGKAKNLKKRIKSYFQKDNDTKTQILVNNIASYEFIATSTETEALILENNLIKKHQPKYNIDLKDSKRYAYIAVTSDKFPRLNIARKRTDEVYGPFVSAKERDYVLTFLRKTFKVRTCNKLPKKACLRFHLKLCDAPCIGNITEEDYLADINKAKEVLKVHSAKLISKLTNEMKSASKKSQFEKAMVLRDQISSLKYLRESQAMERDKKYDEDIINFIIDGNTVYLALFNIHKGTLINKQEYTFGRTEDFLEEFILQYYLDNPIPKELVLPLKISPALGEVISKRRKIKVKFTVPKKGDKHHLLELVKKNIELSFFGDKDKLIALQKSLKLNEYPKIIECFDISHLSGTSMVGSMVQFREGVPDKSNYRRFRIKTVEGIDDVSSIAEVVTRRYRRQLLESGELPELIIIDGGKGQLNSAKKSLAQLNVKIPIISIAKRFEEIYVPALRFPLKLDKKDPSLKLIQSIRDEAHRFAIKYNRLLRKKALTI